MTKIERNILIVLFSFFGIPFTFYIFSTIWDYFDLSFYNGENIFIQKSQDACDPCETEPTFLTILLILTLSILFTIFLVKMVKLIALKVR